MGVGNTSYPGGLDTTTNLPIASALVSTELDGDGNANKVHSNLHGVLSEAAVAIEAKIGTGASTPVANRVLRGSGTGTSAWAQVALATDVSGTLPLASLATGALDSGFSITSGFGTINNGASSITTTGALASGAHTIDSDSNGLILGDGQDTSIYATSNSLRISNLLAGNAQEIDWYTADSDGTDNIVHNIWGVGKPTGYTNRERFVYGKIGNEWWFNSDAAGTGTVRPIKFHTGSTLALTIDSNQDLSIPLASKFAFDSGVGDTYIYQESADDLHIVVGGVALIQIDQDVNGGAGAIGYGSGAPNAGFFHRFGSTFTGAGAGDAHGAVFDGTMTGAAGDTARLSMVEIQGSIVTQTATQSIGHISTLALREPQITDNLTGDITVAATLHVANAPTEGETNAAIYVAAGAVHIDSTPADTVVSGVTASFTAGEALEDGEVVYLKASDSKVWKAVATAAATSRAIGMVVKDAAADATVQVLLQGFLRADTNFPTWTIGGALYTPEAETSSKNVPEQAAPASDGDFVQVLGWASDANTVYFNPSNDIIEHA